MPADFVAGTSQVCRHLTDLDGSMEKENMLKKFKTVVNWYFGRRNTSDGRPPAKRRKIAVPSCDVCQVTLARPFVCLMCSYSGCFRGGTHIQIHLQEEGHGFCVDAKSGSVYCCDCNDFVYDPTFTKVLSSLTTTATARYNLCQADKMYVDTYKEWIPDNKENELLEGAVPLPCQGRRGLLNLGQTCFMNAILQSFLANPLLRNFFLSDKHPDKLCKTANCTCCEMDRLFSEVYSGKGGPFGPTSFLTTTWKASSELAGYSQQDAHEFFISTLNQIHATSRGSTKAQCDCIVHTTFDGLLQSDVRCERCSNVTPTTDPMLDISLEIEGKGSEALRQDLTLASCLRKYTHPEKLGTNDYSCAKCGKGAHASKRLSIKRLPPVLSFQFKRFEHPTNDRSSARKIESPVRFPASLNMAEFTTYAQDSQGAKSGAGISYPGPDSMYEYDLFSVICHEGQIDNGHYTCFTRHNDEWYRYDDDKVTHSTLGACLSSQAYMCFYVKRHLDYTPHTKPSYRKAREAEAVKEKERERKEAARMREVEDALLATV